MDQKDWGMFINNSSLKQIKLILDSFILSGIFRDMDLSNFLLQFLYQIHSLHFVLQ